MANDRTSVEGQIGLIAVIILAVVNVLFGVIGIIGNAVTCLAVWKNPLLQAGVNFCIVSLSVADLLVCVFTQPIYVLSLIGFTSKHFMVFYYIVTSTSLYASLNNLLLMTANRVVAIFYPLRYKSIMSKRNVLFCIGFIWVLSIIEGVLRTLTIFKQFTPHIRICAVLLFISMYAKIFHVSQKQRKMIVRQAKSLTYNYKLATIDFENRASKTASIIVSSFVISFLPITLLLMIDSSNKLAVEICFTIMCCSSAINPVVYAWRNQRFRSEAVNLFRPRSRRVAPLSSLSQLNSQDITSRGLDPNALNKTFDNIAVFTSYRAL
ncbi:alpha-1A adrenergic receptor-like [Actinia tenebrosa]|uniref:Alpha-1A adrenergic receptor-like n=1 Tax=Actinia tenebrosa TaxID=6105 RepID=A0A6P8ICW9_ACTTE|nr:alpha-1A adrenergic receptor-like [Actinia tenebrosa]